MGSLLGSRILITGGAGFLSQHLCKKILNEHNVNKIFLLDRASNFNNFLKFSMEKVDYINLDLNNSDELITFIKETKPTHVFHNAAIINQKLDLAGLRSSMKVNFFGTYNLLSSLITTPLQSFIFTSSSEVYGSNQSPFHEDLPLKPTSPYSISKASAEMLVSAFSSENNIPHTIIRPFNVFGEGQSTSMLIPHLFTLLVNGKDIDVTKGEQTRDSNYVSDICEGLILASNSTEAIGEIINLCSGVELSIKELIHKIINISGIKAKPNFGAIPYRKNEIWRMYGDTKKSNTLLNWKPKVDIDTGLFKTFKWYSNNNKI